jgi:hypothetical protein
MLTRLANVIHWFCALLAVGWAVLIYNMVTLTQKHWPATSERLTSFCASRER